MREAELRLEAKIEATKSDLVKWLFGTIGFQTIIILGAAVALARRAELTVVLAVCGGIRLVLSRRTA